MIKRITLWILLLGLLPAVYAGSGGDLTPDVPVAGEIAERGEQDIYTFTGETDQRISLAVTADRDSSLDTVLELYDPEGEFLASNDDADGATTNSQIDITLTSDGEYRVVVQAFAGATVGAYEVVLTYGDAASNSGDSGDTALVYNELRMGVLDGGASFDYNFAGATGDRLSILVNSEFDSLLEVYDPSGEQVAADDDGGAGLNPFIRNLVLTEDGDYTLTLRSYPNEPTGDYDVTILELETLPETIAYDSSADGSIEENQIALYEFEGSVGDSLDIAVIGGFDTYLQIRNSAGIVVAEDDDSGGEAQAALTDFTISTSDVYTIEVMGFSPSEFGDFNLTVSLTNQLSVLEESQAIAYGETIEAALSGGSSANLTFTGAAGDVITILVDASFDSQLGLYNSSGDLVAGDDDSGSGLNPLLENITLPEDDEYLIELSGFAEEEGGRFSITLASGETVVSSTSSETMAYGDTVAGELAPGESVAFMFSGAAGETVTIRVQASFDSYAELFKPNGELLTSDDDAGGDLNPLIENVTLAETGDYQIVLSAFDPATSGSFTISLEQGESQVVDENDATTILNVGDNISGAVELDGTSEFVFNGTAGDLVSVGVSAADWFGQLDLYVRLVQPNGELLAEDDDSGWLYNPALYGVELPATGTYTIEVSSFEGSSEGEFDLTLLEGAVYISPNSEPAQPLPLNNGMAQISITFPSASTELYEFEAEAGQTITIDATSTDIALAVYTPADLAESLLDPNQPLELSVSGTYLLIAFSESGGQQSFTVTLSGGGGEVPEVVAIEPFSTSRGDMVADRPERGTLQTSETQIWTFKPLLNGTYSIVLNSQDSEGRYDPYLRILNADGSVLAEDDDTGGNFNALVENLELVADQSITIEVRGFADQRGGDYTLVVVSEAVEPPPVLRGGTLTIGSVVDNALLIPSQRIAFDLLIPEDGNYTFMLSGLKLPYVDITDADGNLIGRGVSGIVGQHLSAGTYTLTIYDRLNRTGGFSLEIQ